MKRHLKLLLLTFKISFVFITVPFCINADELEILPLPEKLPPEKAAIAEANYKKYCVLCHGENRQGYANDNAPSLRSKSLFESGYRSIILTTEYGRGGTPMGGYLDEIGGPMSTEEIKELTYWLHQQSDAKHRVKLSIKPVHGDKDRGEQLYKQTCVGCHGVEGEGINAPALGNQSSLVYNKDEFIRYAIQNGRQGTPMPAFKDVLSAEDINSITAFLRSRATGWEIPKPVLKKLPAPEQFIMNPEGDEPNFKLSEGMYIYSKELHAALEAKERMMLFDTRVTSLWQQVHIEGAVPMPYYTRAELDKITKELPKDVQIVAYCACPRAAAVSVVKKLREKGFTKTAVLHEGIFGWMNLGYPVTRANISSLE